MAYTLLGDLAPFDRTWPQFVLDATVPTLLGRYNHRAWFESNDHPRPLNDSTRSSPSQPPEHPDQQGASKLIEYVFQKLQRTVRNEAKPKDPRHPTSSQLHKRKVE